MRALVTGGAGFVGRHLCKALLDRGWDVVCVDPVVQRTGGLSPANWPLYDPRGYARFTYVDQDCRDYFHLNEAFDYAFHLAAMVGGRLMIECDPLAVAEDLAIDADFFRYALRVKPKKVVFFSSSAAYPISLQRRENYILLREDMIDFRENIGMPDMSYGWAKLTREYLARLAHQHYGLDVICYRPFSGYGEDQDLTYPFPSICRRALQSRGAPEITVWGTGDQMRDFIHIDDAVSFVLASVDSICNGDALNLSSGELTSFKRLASLATNAAGFDPVVVGNVGQAGRRVRAGRRSRPAGGDWIASDRLPGGGDAAQCRVPGPHGWAEAGGDHANFSCNATSPAAAALRCLAHPLCELNIDDLARTPRPQLCDRLQAFLPVPHLVLPVGERSLYASMDRALCRKPPEQVRIPFRGDDGGMRLQSAAFFPNRPPT